MAIRAGSGSLRFAQCQQIRCQLFGFSKIGTLGSLTSYSFTHEGWAGSFAMDTITGDFTDVVVPESAVAKRACLFAQHKVLKAWQAGDLPETLEWGRLAVDVCSRRS